MGRGRCVLPGSALLDRDRAAHRVNDASKLDQEAVAGYSLSGRVLFGLRVDHFAEEGLETFERIAIAFALIIENPTLIHLTQKG